MNSYSIALFLHIVGALGFFVALGLEWTSLRQLRRATTTEQVQEWLRVAGGVGRVVRASMLTLLLSGFYMIAAVWGGVPWIIVTLGTLVLLMILARTLSIPRMAAIGRTVAGETGLVSSTLHSLLRDPLLWIASQTRVAIALGIVFLMTVKPDLGGSLLTIGAAMALGLASGLASGLPILSRRRTQEEPAS